MEKILTPLRSAAETCVPRLLTQASRDPDAPHYGCFDRNWWHYKIRDFPSIILQQGGYAAFLASRLRAFNPLASGFEDLARGAIRFWAYRAMRHGAFEEYYPWEQGYPPLAFSTLAMAKLHLHGLGQGMEPAFRRAAKQLLHRFEDRAANQQVAGLAALATLRRISPEWVSQKDFESLSARTLALQHSEGWFMEYDGPDLGYLTVTLDCLWDLYDLTGEERFLNSAVRAFAYIEWFVTKPGHAAGMHNARNTDYLVPYGITRFLALGRDYHDRAVALLEPLYAKADQPDHFLAAVDDRYISHYIGHSIIRAVLVLDENHLDFPERHPLPRNPPFIQPLMTTWLEGSGHWVPCPGLLVSGRKGGIVTWSVPSGGRIADFGWIVRRGKTAFVSHWWSPDWKIEQDAEAIHISGHLFPHVERASSPWKHFILRFLSFLLGHHLIGILKSLLIFKSKSCQFKFHRQISRQGASSLLIEDTISGVGADDIVLRASRSSKRHVASADSFHTEDFSLASGCSITETREMSKTGLRILTTCQFPD